MLIHVDKKTGTKTEIAPEQFAKVFGADNPNVDKVNAALAGLKKQEQVWVTQLMVVALLARVGRNNPVHSEFRATLNTYVPHVCFEDSGRKTLTAQAAQIATKATGSYYVHDGLKLAQGESLKASCKVSRDTLYAKWVSLTQVQRDALAENVIIPWAQTLCGMDKDKANACKAKANEVLAVTATPVTVTATATPPSSKGDESKVSKGTTKGKGKV